MMSNSSEVLIRASLIVEPDGTKTVVIPSSIGGQYVRGIRDEDLVAVIEAGPLANEVFRIKNYVVIRIKE